MSCIWIDLEKQIVLRTNRLIRVGNMRCFRSICCVLRLPGRLSFLAHKRPHLVHFGLFRQPYADSHLIQI
jgi:hypothetical protein